MTSAAQINRLSQPVRWIDADAYLFDIDGTLLNSRDAVHYFAFRDAMREHFGLELRIDGVPVHGNTDVGILRAVLQREGVPEADFQSKLPDMLRSLCANVARNRRDLRPEVCPSIVELLQTLKAAGKLLGVASGNLEPVAWLKLEACGLRGYFSFGSFSDRRPTRPEIFAAAVQDVAGMLGPAATVCVIGDTPSDIQAAKAAGIPVIAVATGIFSREELEAHAPDLVAGCCTGLLPHLSVSP